MSKRRSLVATVGCVCLAIAWMWFASSRGSAEEPAKYVGTDVCLKCHAKMSKNWAMTVHRRTLFNTEQSKRGCEACHGPGSAHVAGGGDPTMIVRPERLKPDQTASICMKCHTQEYVTLWRTSAHARAKVSCINCHDLHSPDTENLSKDIEDAKLQLDGLSRSIHQAELSYQTAPKDSAEKADAWEKVVELKAKRDKLLTELKGNETLFQRTSEPYMCYTCHKSKQAQGNLPSHHPIREGKMKCSDCHNPHGGPSGMLRAESVNETCFKCHAEKLGPYVYDHPPVTEDCTICHNPHGTVNNNLLVQPESFLCLKCHPSPHSRSTSLDPATSTFEKFAERGKCLSCHEQIHGPDEHRRFMN